EYAGTYDPVAGMQIDERVYTYEYDVHDVTGDLDLATNGWVMRKMTVYKSDGIEVDYINEYDVNGRLISEDLGDTTYLGYDYYPYNGAYSTERHYYHTMSRFGEVAMTRSGEVIKEAVFPPTIGSGTSAYFDGTGDYLATMHNDAYNFGTGNFTIDFWVNFESTPHTCLLDLGGYSQGIRIDAFDHGSEIAIWMTGSSQNFIWAPLINTWHHLAVVRNGDTLSIYGDGVFIGSMDVTGRDISNLTSGIRIGMALNGAIPFNGWMDEIHISDVARWSTNFPLPGAYPPDLSTVFHADFDEAGDTSFVCETKVDKIVDSIEVDVDGITPINIIYGQFTTETYAGGNLKRQLEAGANRLYEYENEDFVAVGQGRTTLVVDSSNRIYRTYDWGEIDPTVAADSVRVTEYSGAYSTVYGDPVRPNRAPEIVAVTYIYEHNGEQIDLGLLTNGWRLLSEDVVGDAYYEYEYFRNNPNRVRYKRVYQSSGGTLYTTFEYVSDSFIVRRDENVGGSYNGSIFTYKIIDGIEYLNTEVDISGVLTVYKYTDQMEFSGATKYHDDGTVEKCDAGWNVVSTITPSRPFVKGVNMPWMNYGYDIGNDVLGGGSHYGLTTKMAELYEKLEARKGDYVRVFLFNDLRAGITFSGSDPIAFTANVYEDMDVLVAAAEALDIKLIPVLFDYKLADGRSTETPDGINYYAVGERPQLITDTTSRDTLISIIQPFIANYASSSAIHAWEIMNEPDLVTAATLTQVQ
ncbi:MAG: LamG-like jellyroll fold domain-containing protein, partial [Candidatus Omnitrophota bacterium]